MTDDLVPLREPRPAVHPDRLYLFVSVGVWLRRDDAPEALRREYREIDQGLLPESAKFWRDASLYLNGLNDADGSTDRKAWRLAMECAGVSSKMIGRMIVEWKPNGGGA